MSTLTLRSSLPLEECQARLQTHADVERLGFTWTGYAGSKPILVKLKGNDFRLQKRRFYHNSFAPLFYGRLQVAPTGTLIQGVFRLHPFVKVIMGLWLSGLALLLWLFYPGLVQSPASWAFFGLPVVGAAIVYSGTWLARNDKPAILSFLQTSLELQPTAEERE
ncbi:MAG: hypothetical protein JSR82_09040 [Verrucomicrobia bacterium]|nr:hypothetical protein [Verrucomicrobiota bacterium]